MQEAGSATESRVTARTSAHSHSASRVQPASQSPLVTDGLPPSSGRRRSCGGDANVEVVSSVLRRAP